MVERAVLSVLRQSYPRIELIVCDDGSDWKSYENLRRLLSEHGAIYIRFEHARGACAARNQAIKMAKGSLITGLDDDDEFAEKHIENLVSAFKPEYSFVTASYIQVNNTGRWPKKYGIGMISLDAQLHYNRVGNQVLTETDRMISVGMFDESMPAMQDYDVWIRLLSTYGPGLKLPQCTYIQHIEHEMGRISDRRAGLAEAFEKLQQKHADLFSKSHLQSHKLMDSKISDTQLGLLDMILVTNRHNFRWSVALYLKFCRRNFHKVFDELRSVFK